MPILMYGRSRSSKSSFSVFSMQCISAGSGGRFYVLTFVSWSLSIVLGELFSRQYHCCRRRYSKCEFTRNKIYNVSQIKAEGLFEH